MKGIIRFKDDHIVFIPSGRIDAEALRKTLEGWEFLEVQLDMDDPAIEDEMRVHINKLIEEEK